MRVLNHAAPHNRTATSHAAARVATESGQVGRQARLVLDAFNGYPDGLTRKEIAAATGIPEHTVGARVNWLVAEGLLAEPGNKRVPPGGTMRQNVLYVPGPEHSAPTPPVISQPVPVPSPALLDSAAGGSTNLFGEALETAGAALSPCGTYRYELTRTWDASKPGCLFFMLNPSTADGEKDDPTTRRCVSFAKAWGKGRLTIVNLFSFRATDPAALIRRAEAGEPLNGPDASQYLKRAVEAHGGPEDLIVCAWGAPGQHVALKKRRDGVVRTLANHYRVPLFVLSLTSDGEPGHPLYIPASTVPRRWSPIL